MGPRWKSRVDGYVTLAMILLGALALFRLWYIGSGMLDLAPRSRVAEEGSHELRGSPQWSWWRGTL